MHIAYCIAGFYRAAGMERVLADKANSLAELGHRVTILTTEQKGRPYAFPLDARVNLRDLGIGYEDNNGSSLLDKLIHYPGKQRRHQKALEKVLEELHPDITVSMFCNEVNLLPRLHDGSHKILEVHFSRFKRLQYARGGLWGLADRLRSRQDEKLTRRYERFVVLTQEDRQNWGGNNNIRVIPNPVRFRPQAPVLLESKTVIAVGRFTHQKGLDRLIDAWKIVYEKLGETTGWRLWLVGDGELRQDLQQQIERNGLEKVIRLGTVESNMEKVYESASIVALPSRYEGLPMALLEAQTFGIAAVAFDCQCGPKEIIENGVTGFLVPEGDVQALAESLFRLMTNPSMLHNMGQAAWQQSARWRPEPIMQQWLNLFKEIL